jgi:WD40 repeat protein
MHLQMPFYPSALAFSEDGKRLAIAPVGEPVQIFDPAAGTKLFELKRTIGGTTAVAFSRDRELIATADADTSVRIYDGRSGAMLDHNTDFLLEPFAVVFTPDGKQLLAAGADKVIAVLDVATGEVIRKSKRAADPIGMLDISADGTQVVAGLMHADNMMTIAPLLVMETATGKQLQEWRPANMPLGGGWAIDGHLLVGTTGDTYLHIWRVR